MTSFDLFCERSLSKDTVFQDDDCNHDDLIKVAEIGFLVVSDRGDRHQLDAVGPMKKILFLVEVITTWRSALQCNCIVLVIFNHVP